MVFLVIIFFLATLALFLVGAIATVLTFHTLRIRAGFAIPAEPLLVPTSAEQIPPDLADFLAQVVPALHALGFETVASVHAPQMLATVTWTQVLFLHRGRGDRASVMLLRPTTTTAAAIAASPPALIFGTELSDGRSVKTSTHDAPKPLTDAHIATLYDRHRADVTETLGPTARGEMPEPGDEVPWLQARAGVIATTLAEHVGFIRVTDGQSYRPPWPLALRAAWTATWSHAPRARIFGFDVAPVPSAPAPTPAGKVAGS